VVVVTVMAAVPAVKSEHGPLLPSELLLTERITLQQGSPPEREINRS